MADATLYFQQSASLSNSSLICCYGKSSPQGTILSIGADRATIQLFGHELYCLRVSHDASKTANPWVKIEKANTWRVMAEQCNQASAEDFEMTCYLYPTPIANQKFLDTRIRQYTGSGNARRWIVTVYAHFAVPNKAYFDRVLAITMSTHVSLGTKSQLARLGGDVLRIIAEKAVQPWFGAIVPHDLIAGRTAEIPRWMSRISPSAKFCTSLDLQGTSPNHNSQQEKPPAHATENFRR